MGTWTGLGCRLKYEVEMKRPHPISPEDYSFTKRPLRHMKLAEIGGSRNQPI